MRICWQQLSVCFLVLTLGMVVGCRPLPVVRVYQPSATTPPAPPPTELQSEPLTPLEPDYTKLPMLDPAKADVTGATRATPIGVSEATVAKLAAERAPLAAALERENDVPSAVVDDPHQARHSQPSNSLAREIRPLLAADLRNKAAGDSVASFYQLADAEARSEIMRKSIEALDGLRRAVKDAIARGVKPPLDEDEIDRQRASMIIILGQAELGTKLLETDLRRRIGVPGKTPGRLMPTGEMSISTEATDVEQAVRTGLERRHDLQALRTAYHQLNTENLPEVRDLLRTTPGVPGGLGAGPRLPVFSRIIQRHQAQLLAQLDAVAAAEVEVRRTQLYTLIEEKERAVADEIRAQVAILQEQAKQVGLARWRAEKLLAKVAELKKDKQGALAVVPAELEANRARADVIQAVMAWHQARAKLSSAMGVFVTPVLPEQKIRSETEKRRQSSTTLDEPVSLAPPGSGNRQSE